MLLVELTNSTKDTILINSRIRTGLYSPVFLWHNLILKNSQFFGIIYEKKI